METLIFPWIPVIALEHVAGGVLFCTGVWLLILGAKKNRLALLLYGAALCGFGTALMFPIVSGFPMWRR